MTEINRKKAPSFKQVDNIEFLEVQQTHLDNGIEVNFIPGGSQEIIKIDFIFNAGNLYQNKVLVASSTNNLLKEGSKKYSAQEISEGIDNCGAFLEVENTFDTASLTLYTLTKHLNTVLPIVKEVILYPELSEKEFSIYKKNASENFKTNLEKVSFVARGIFMQTIFGSDHPYGRKIELEDYSKLSLEDITSFYQKNYTLDNCNILISGKVKKEHITKLNAFFGQEIISNNTPSTNHLSLQKKEISPIYITKENALQSAIRIGRIFPIKTHEDYFGLQILNTVLGGYFGSRLMKNIRENKGYTYGIGSRIQSMKEGGYFFISTEVGSDVTKNALEEIYKEIEILRSEEITKEELDLVKNYLLGQLLSSCDGPFNMAALFENVHSYGLDYDFYNNYITAIKNITSKKLLELAVKYLNKKELQEVVVGKM